MKVLSYLDAIGNGLRKCHRWRKASKDLRYWRKQSTPDIQEIPPLYPLRLVAALISAIHPRFNSVTFVRREFTGLEPLDVARLKDCLSSDGCVLPAGFEDSVYPTKTAAELEAAQASESTEELQKEYVRFQATAGFRRVEWWYRNREGYQFGRGIPDSGFDYYREILLSELAEPCDCFLLLEGIRTDVSIQAQSCARNTHDAFTIELTYLDECAAR